MSFKQALRKKLLFHNPREVGGFSEPSFEGESFSNHMYVQEFRIKAHNKGSVGESFYQLLLQLRALCSIATLKRGPTAKPPPSPPPVESSQKAHRKAGKPNDAGRQGKCLSVRQKLSQRVRV